MHEKLQQSENGWQWQREARLATDCLINERGVSIDIMGLHDAHGILAIELKYVTATYCRKCKYNCDKPSNEPAFPYDIAKDCLKIELLMKRLAKPRQAPFTEHMQDIPSYLVTGYVIALTSWPGYWGANGTGQPRDWARHFRTKISQNCVCLQGKIESDGRNPRKNDIWPWRQNAATFRWQCRGRGSGRTIGHGQMRVCRFSIFSSRPPRPASQSTHTTEAPRTPCRS